MRGLFPLWKQLAYWPEQMWSRQPVLGASVARNVRWAKLPFMLLMVIERFKDGNAKPIGERFRRDGRMLPDGVIYHASWVDTAGARCFQLMEAPDPESLAAWTRRWDDLVEFEIVPVLTSADFWSKIQLA
jgi:hypothetical protein